MKRKLCRLFFGILCAVSLTGCGKGGKTDSKNTNKNEMENNISENKTSKNNVSENDASKNNALKKVELVVWCAKEDTELMQEVTSGFKENYKGQADFQITFQEQGESQCKDALLGALEDGADVFTFADDQLNALAAAGALEPIEHADKIKSENLSSAVEAATVNGKLYAYPLTADNGYFLYYNKQYITKKQLKTLDGILDAAAKCGGQFTMDWSSAWYVYSFFGNTGLEVGLNNDGITNYCTWNQADGDIRGIDVANAMLKIAGHPGFASCTDEEFLNGVQNGSVAAGVSGVWNAVAIEKAWGEHAGAAKLPTFTCNGKQVQMASFSGCKLIGVNAYSKYPKWAARLAEWITNEKNQQLRFQMRGQGPSNIAVADSKEIQRSFAIAALLEQSEFSQLQRVGGKFWEPVSKFAGNMASGNLSGQSLQEQLDEMAEGICAR